MEKNILGKDKISYEILEGEERNNLFLILESRTLERELIMILHRWGAVREKDGSLEGKC